MHTEGCLRRKPSLVCWVWLWVVRKGPAQRATGRSSLPLVQKAAALHQDAPEQHHHPDVSPSRDPASNWCSPSPAQQPNKKNSLPLSSPQIWPNTRRPRQAGRAQGRHPLTGVHPTSGGSLLPLSVSTPRCTMLRGENRRTAFAVKQKQKEPATR